MDPSVCVSSAYVLFRPVGWGQLQSYAFVRSKEISLRFGSNWRFCQTMVCWCKAGQLLNDRFTSVRISVADRSCHEVRARGTHFGAASAMGTCSFKSEKRAPVFLGAMGRFDDESRGREVGARPRCNEMEQKNHAF